MIKIILQGRKQSDTTWLLFVDIAGWRNAMKGEMVTTGGKGRGEIGGEAGEVTGVVAD